MPMIMLGKLAWEGAKLGALWGALIVVAAVDDGVRLVRKVRRFGALPMG